MTKKLLVWFGDVGKTDTALVGGKGANLGEMTKAGFPVPPGFIVTANAYYAFIKENNLEIKIKQLLGHVDYNDQKSLQTAAKRIKKEILSGKMSQELVAEIFDAYKRLSGVLKDALVAVRSSATAEDLPNASFAGQQETYLNVEGDANVVIKIKEAWASLFGARAIFYRHEQKFDHFTVGIAIPVQKMVESDSSGIMFSIDPVTNDKSKIVIEAIFGLGGYVVGGIVTPDHYEVKKSSLKILEKKVVEQTKMLVKKGKENKETKLSKKEGNKQKISDKNILELAELSKKLEKHYYFPQDSEWAVEKGKVFVVQTRPVTTTKPTRNNSHDTKNLNLQVILKGDPASPGIATGPVKVLKSAKEIDKVKQGDVLVAPQTNPDFVPAMKRAVAIVTDSGGRTSHAAIVSREIGIPAIQTATKVYVNLAEPEFAERIASRHVDGVGLLRAEFMMAAIGTHPRKMIHDGKSKEFVNKLADDLGTFCKAFSPRPVVYRASDFKTNEYRNLIGGKEYEPVEPNPMLGYRGAFRYMHDAKVFDLELEAIKKVRNTMGLKNIWLMIPFVRTVNELVEVKKIISASGLYRTPSFKLWMMVEIPSNVISLEEFIKVGIDGVSIGSNDLTMLMLGTDRDNNEVATEFNEQDPAVLWAFEHVIKTCHKYKVTSSMCGQAPSQYPDLLEKLVKWGITSVSVSPDVIESVRENLSKYEKKLIS